jgi:hypothetical protein
MGTDTGFASPLRLFSENPVAVLERLRQGYVDYMGWAADQVTDEHLLYALKSGLLDECAAAFPDPRLAPEIPIRVLLAACLAGAFQGEYALSQAGPALTSPAVLAELGLNVQWVAPGAGLSRRGTEADGVFHSDTLRKLLGQIADADHKAGRRRGESLLRWWNETVGRALLQRAGGGTGAWIWDCTKLLVNLDNPRYEGSAVTKDEDDQPIRGYKLALLSSLIDSGRVIVQVGWESVRPADITVGRPLLQGDTPLEAGDTLLHDRGLIDGALITCLKRDLGVDVVFGLKKSMLSYRTALALMRREASYWKAHPTRKGQEIQRVENIRGPWTECAVPLNGCVVRERDSREPDGYRYYVFATTHLQRSARGIVRDYGCRSECEEDHRQIKGPNWEMDEFHSTALVEVIFHVLMVLWAYNLAQVYGETEAGQRFAGKTKRARQREVRRERELRVVVIAGGEYAVLPHWEVADVLLEIEGAPKERLRQRVRELKREDTAGKQAVG